MRSNHNSPANGDGLPREAAELLLQLALSGGLPSLDPPTAARRTPPEPALQRWERLYAQGVALKEAMNPAYIDAVASTFAAAILACGKDQVKLLVVGGGDGHFSRKVLPAVMNLVNAVNSSVGVEVLETDLTEAILRAPGKTAVVDVKELDRHFAAGSFDVVVGEAMLHQGGRKGIGKTMQQIAHVLSNTGTFVHVQDTVPDPTDWIAPERLRELGVRGAPMMQVGSDGARQNLMAMADEAHSGLANAMHSEAKSLKGAFMLMGAEGTGMTDINAFPPNLVPAGYTALHYSHGGMGGEHDPEVPSGKYRLTYRAMVSCFRPHVQLKSLLAAIEQFCEMTAPPIQPPEE